METFAHIFGLILCGGLAFMFLKTGIFHSDEEVEQELTMSNYCNPDVPAYHDNSSTLSKRMVSIFWGIIFLICAIIMVILLFSE